MVAAPVKKPLTHKKSRSDESRRAPRALNVPLLVGTLVVLGVLAPSAYFWRSFQVKRSAGAMLDRAEALAEEENWERAAAYTFRYLQLSPQGAEADQARVDLARYFDRSADTARSKMRAIELYYRALGVAPPEERRELRLRLAELLVETGRYIEAEAAAKTLLEDDDDDPAGLRLLALARFGLYRTGAMSGATGDLKGVSRAFIDAVQHNPQDIQLAGTLARIYRQEPTLLAKVPIEGSEESRDLTQRERTALADKVMDDLVEKNQANARAYLARFQYRQQFGLDGASNDLAMALQVCPKAWEVVNWSSAADRLPRLQEPSNELVAVWLGCEYVPGLWLTRGADDLAVVIAAAEYERLAGVAAVQKAYLLTTKSSSVQASREGFSELYDMLLREEEAHDEHRVARRHFDRGILLFKDAVSLAPTSEVAHLGLGEAHLGSGDTDAAIATWQEWLRRVDGDSVALRTRVAVTLIENKRLGDAASALDDLDDAITKVLPSLNSEARIALYRSQSVLQAKFHVERSEPLAAIPLLRNALASHNRGTSDLAEQFQAWLLLGNAYQMLGEWDQAALAFDEASRIDPSAATVRAAAARAWLAADRPDSAISRCLQGGELAFSPEMEFLLAGARIQFLVARPVEERQWGEFAAGLARLDRYVQQGFLGDPWRVLLMRADYEVIRAEERGDPLVGKLAARELMVDAQRQYPGDAKLLQRLVLAYENLELPPTTPWIVHWLHMDLPADDADRVLKELKRREPDALETFVVEARLLSGRGKYDDARAVLDRALARTEWSPEDRFELGYQRAQVSMRAADYARASSEIEELRKSKPNDVRLLRELAELSLETGRFGETMHWVAKLEELEGRDSSHARYYRARRALAQVADTQSAEFRQAVTDQEMLASTRPAWPQTYLLKALIEQRRGNLELALEAYKAAIDRGEQRVAVFEQVIGLLDQLDRPFDAEPYWARLAGTIPLSHRLTVFATSKALRERNLDAAVAIARRRIESDPNDPMGRVWLGRVLMAVGKGEEAEAEFRAAVDMAQGDLRGWNGLFTYYRSQGKLDLARQALDDMIEKSDLSEAQRAFIYAQGCEMLGDDEKAEANYLEAERLAPGSIAVKMRLAGFYLLRDLDAAEQRLNYVLGQTPDSPTARRAKAAVLATKGGEENWSEIERLLSHTPTDDVAVSGLDRRLQAVLLVQREADAGGQRLEHLKRAQSLLEELTRDARVAVPGDFLLLAQLHERLSRFEESDSDRHARLYAAREQFLALVTRERPEFSHLALFVEFLVRNDMQSEAQRRLQRLDELLVERKKTLDSRVETDDKEKAQYVDQMARLIDLWLRLKQLDQADAWLQKLETEKGESFRTVTLRVRWLKASDRSDEIAPAVDDLAERMLAQVATQVPGDEKAQDEKRASICLTAGTVCVSVGQDAAAERWYRQLLRFNSQRFEPLALALARQHDSDKLREAISLCQAAATTDKSTQPALALAAVLMAGKPQDADFADAEGLLQSTLARHRDDVGLLFSIGSLRIVAGRSNDAIELFRKVIRINPDHVFALNNLATVLGEHAEHRQEALELIDRALQRAGAQPALYDTKGMILVYDGQADEALTYLERAAGSSSKDPRYQLHLAKAYKDNGALANAREEMIKALEGDLEKTILTGGDRRLLVELTPLVDELQ